MRRPPVENVGEHRTGLHMEVRTHQSLILYASSPPSDSPSPGAARRPRHQVSIEPTPLARCIETRSPTLGRPSPAHTKCTCCDCGRVAEVARNVSKSPGKERAISPVTGGRKGQPSRPHPHPCQTRLTDCMSGISHHKHTSEPRIHTVDVCMTTTRKR